MTYSNYIKLPSSIWVSCSPLIAPVQQRLVVELVDVHGTSIMKWTPPRRLTLGVIFRQHHSSRVTLIEYYQKDNIQKLILSCLFM